MLIKVMLIKKDVGKDAHIEKDLSNHHQNREKLNF